MADRIISEITKAAVCCDVQCRPMLVGSCARGTWLSGDYDLDIFLAVPPNRELTSALLPARMVAKVYEERYASHPYIHAMIDGFEVDLVPCFDLQDAKNIESAVDRSPFHNRYVAGRIAGHEDDVLLLKQFMKGVGVYGSEQRLGGFSGYLSELLVLQYGSFKGVLEAASCFHPGQVIDLENHSSLSHSDPLVVVDPVDPKRNVAAALTIDRLFQFSAASRCFLAAPDIDFFFPPESKPLETSELLRLMKERGTMFILVEFVAPDVVEDVLFPQLKKADASITALLSRHGFSVMRSDFEVSVDKKIAWLLFELDVFRLPSVEKRVGPPAHAVAHLSRFLEGHKDRFSGPYLEGGRIVVEVKRMYEEPIALLLNEMSKIGLGKHLRGSMAPGLRLISGADILQGASFELRHFLSAYLMRRIWACDDDPATP